MTWRTLCLPPALAAAVLVVSPAAAKPFSYSYKTKSADFDFSWSSEAAAVPGLVKQLRVQLAKEKASTIRGGKDDYAMRQIGWQSSTRITTSGKSARLLSLSREYWAFTGGAHGNGATTGILWDRKLRKAVSFDFLFSAPSAYVALLRAPYCRALDAERKKRRGGDGKLGTLDEFNSCPKLSELAIIPADPGHDGRFDQLHLIAAAYLAGPYVEGDYDIVLPVSGSLIRSIKPQYRRSFEAQRQ